MKSLSENWVTEGLIDFEYKKYLLLAYLKEVNKYFYKQELFPSLSDLVMHYRNLEELKQRKTMLMDGFPKELKQADIEKAKLIYEKLIEDTDLMKELEDIISFALPKLKDQLEEGKELYEFYEEHMGIEPVGITPVNLDYGYLFLSADGKKSTRVYEFQVTVFEGAKEKFRGIRTDFVKSFYRSLANTFENVKNELIRTRKHLPVPATYSVVSSMPCPHQATMLPIAQRMLIREISKNE